MAQLVLKNILAGSGNVLAGGDTNGNVTKVTIGSNLTLTGGVLSATGGGSTLTLTTTGTSGAATYNSGTGVLNIPIYTAGVSSVFGRTGAVVAVSGDYDTDKVTEGTTNLYFTNARARGVLSTNVGSALTYNSTTGRFTLEAAATGVSGYLTSTDYAYFDSKQASLGTGTTAQYLRGDLTWAAPPTPALDDLTDVTITSVTNGQVLRWRIDHWENWTLPTAAVTSVFTRTGDVVATSGDYNTDQVTEGTTNLYFTNTRARGVLSTNVGSALTYNSTTGRFTLNAAATGIDGYITGADYDYWNAKQASLGTGTTSQYLRGDLTWATPPSGSLAGLSDVSITTPSNGQLLRYQTGTWINFTPTYVAAGFFSATAPLTYNSTTGVFAMPVATSTASGYLSNTDWATFNGKQAALGFTPYNATNPSGYISGINSSMVTTALGYTPYNSTNPSGYITGISSAMVTGALGYTPYNSTNPSGYITGISSGMVTTALGYTPYNSSNPSGYITSSALSSYLPLSGGTLSGSLTAPGFFESSDKRLKTQLEANYKPQNVIDIQSYLYIKNGKEEVGYYAQEVLDIIPSAVSEGSDGFLTVAYNQVLVAKIANLEGELKELKEIVKTLANELVRNSK
jgi:hypothetical protein